MRQQLNLIAINRHVPAALNEADSAAVDQLMAAMMPFYDSSHDFIAEFTPLLFQRAALIGCFLWIYPR